jgi:hypothetical protein
MNNNNKMNKSFFENFIITGMNILIYKSTYKKSKKENFIHPFYYLCYTYWLS